MEVWSTSQLNFNPPLLLNKGGFFIYTPEALAKEFYSWNSILRSLQDAHKIVSWTNPDLSRDLGLIPVVSDKNIETYYRFHLWLRLKQFKTKTPCFLTIV